MCCRQLKLGDFSNLDFAVGKRVWDVQKFVVGRCAASVQSFPSLKNELESTFHSAS